MLACPWCRHPVTGFPCLHGEQSTWNFGISGISGTCTKRLRVRPPCVRRSARPFEAANAEGAGHQGQFRFWISDFGFRIGLRKRVTGDSAFLQPATIGFHPPPTIHHPRTPLPAPRAPPPAPAPPRFPRPPSLIPRRSRGIRHCRPLANRGTKGGTTSARTWAVRTRNRRARLSGPGYWHRSARPWRRRGTGGNS